MTECKRCHTAITMFWWPVSFSGDWEDRFYLCDGCMHDLIEFMKESKERKTVENLRKFMEKTCPFCGAIARIIDAPRQLYGCSNCFKKFDIFDKEVPQ